MFCFDIHNKEFVARFWRRKIKIESVGKIDANYFSKRYWDILLDTTESRRQIKFESVKRVDKSREI